MVDSTSSSMGKTFAYECGTKRSLINNNTDSIVNRSLVSPLDLMIQGKANFSSAFLFKKGVSIGVNVLFSITLNSTIQVALSIFH